MKRLNQAAFTVVETLFVLGVAGLIFLIIFGAIPALIRNSNNNQRKQDVAALLDAVSEFQLRNSGNFPPDYTTLSTTGAGGVGPIKLSYFEPSPSAINLASGSVPACPAPITSVALDKVDICNFRLCDPAGAIASGAGYRDIVAVYDIETAAGPVIKCQQH